MSSTDATTTDGFRVGRRVRYRWNHECRGEITAKTRKRLEWDVTWDSGEQAPSLQNDLVLLPDDEPDAPATHEPRFKPGDPVTFTSCTGDAPRDATVIGQARPSTTGETTWHIRFPEGSQTSALDGELVPAVAYDPREPEAVASGKPHYYVKLRDAGCEPFAVIAACLPLDKAIAYHQATAIAYLIRAEHKHDSPGDDIRKAHAHLAEAVSILDSTTTSPTNQSLH